MNIKSFLPVLLIALLQLVACQQKNDNGRDKQPLNDSSRVSPTAIGPEADIKAEKKDRAKDTVPVRTRMELRSMEAQVLGAGTKIGKPGDMLLSFTGQGFVFTEKNPVLVAGDLKFDNTYSNEKGTEFYVVIPAESRQRLLGIAQRGLQVVNPDNETASFKEAAADIIKRADGVKKVKLVFTQYAVAREEEK